MAATCAAFATAPVCAVKAAPARKQATFNGLARVTLKKAETTFEQCTVSNGIKTRQMLVWQPTDNKYFETLSYLPPLSDDDISKQVEYIIRNGWIPALEFSEAVSAYVGNGSTIRMNVSSGFYDNRYWTLYKLPMFGCTDPSQVLGEIKNATKAFPDAYIRLVAFDNVKQVQMLGMLVHRPPSATDYRPIDKRNA